MYNELILHIFRKEKTKNIHDVFLFMVIIVFSFDRSIMTQKNFIESIMKKIDLKKLKGSLSRNEQRKIKGGVREEDPYTDLGCACTNAQCAASHGGNGDSYCNGTFCCG
ncbi:hypothetical protein SRABI04_03290 [Chryseobacterium sp. Bi04]|nr:hypothetical protein SRABI04_03290 [Chryseobacterium sp. Bi04]